LAQGSFKALKILSLLNVIRPNSLDFKRQMRVLLVPAIPAARLTIPVSARAVRNRSRRSLVSLSRFIGQLDRFPGA